MTYHYEISLYFNRKSPEKLRSYFKFLSATNCNASDYNKEKKITTAYINTEVPLNLEDVRDLLDGIHVVSVKKSLY